MAEDAKPEEKKTLPLLVINLANQDLPVFVEKKGKDWIYYGEQNDYPYYLLELYQRCAYHKAIVDRKVQNIIGEGWGFETRGLTVGMQGALQEEFKKLWRGDGETLVSATAKLATDGEVFNGMAVEMIPSKAGGKLAETNHLPWCHIRTNGKSGKDERFYYTRYWYKQAANGQYKINQNPQTEDDFTEYEPYNPQTFGKSKNKQLLVVRGYDPFLKAYPLPTYISAVTAIDADVQLVDFHYYNIVGGFVGGTLMNFYNGEPTEKVKEEIEKAVMSKFRGPRGQRIVLNFAKSKDNGADISAIPTNDLDKQFAEVDKQLQQRIFTGHNVVSSMLFAVKEPGQLGGRTELDIADYIFKTDYVPGRQSLIEQLMNTIAAAVGFKPRLFLKKKPPLPVMFDANTIAQNLTRDELRKIILPAVGLAPQTKQQFADQGEAIQCDPADIELFKSFGTPRGELTVLSSVPFEFSEGMDVEAQERMLCATAMQFAKKEISVKTLDRSVLDLLEKEPLTTPETIAKVLNVSVEQVNASIKKLTEGGALKKGGTEEDPEYTPTGKGADIIEEQPAKTEDIYVAYSYELAPGFKTPILPTTRDFCRELVNADRLYSRQDIEAMSAKAGYNVWMMRGGWYTVPGTTLHKPQCRHIWKQNVVKR